MAWTDADIARFLDRRARLIRWGWAQPQAEKLAERLHLRDLEGDDRRDCLECLNMRRDRRCSARTVADVPGGELIDALPAILQRCGQFKDAIPRA